MIRQLISNATKFTNQGSVDINIRRDSDCCILEVTDTGTGIKPEQREEIFELFRQADTSFTRKHEGAGLGLAIVRRLADLLNIEVELESELQTGSRFKLRIPELVPSAEVKEIPETSIQTHDTDAEEEDKTGKKEEQSKTVLIVDDDPYTVEVLGEYLEAEGNYRVQKAYTGMHAMIYLAESKPDYLLVDLMMPQISGERVIRYCHELWGEREVQIIVVTGKTMETEEIRQLSKKVDNIIPKGNLRPQTLATALHNAMSLPNREEQVAS